MENEKSKSSHKIFESIVVAFIIAYGMHYFGYFIRARYYTLLDSIGFSEGVGHVFNYLGHLVFLIVMLIYAWAVKNDRQYIFSFTKTKASQNIKWLLIGALTGVGLMGICVLSAALHGDLTITVNNSRNVGLFVSALLAVLVQASIEEIESRGFLFGRMIGEGVPVGLAIPISALFFSYIHAANPGFGLIPFISIVVIGLFFALSYHYFGNLWFCFGVHTLWNFSQDFIFGLPDSGKPAAVSIVNSTVNSSSFFYDGEFGIEGSFMAISLNILACIVVFLIGRKRKNK